LQEAWLEGSWAIARGAFFGAVLDESINGIAPWEGVTARTLRAKKKRVHVGDGVYLEGFGSDEWRWFIAHDFGTAAPSYTGLVTAGAKIPIKPVEKSPAPQAGGVTVV